MRQVATRIQQISIRPRRDRRIKTETFKIANKREDTQSFLLIILDWVLCEGEKYYDFGRLGAGFSCLFIFFVNIPVFAAPNRPNLFETAGKVTVLKKSGEIYKYIIWINFI